jgi:hypothetical protein
MSTDILSDASSVTALLRQVVLPLVPRSMQEQVERDLPMLGLLAHPLGVEVMVAEQRGLRFSQAVRRPECLNMGRVYFCAMNLLQWELPASIRQALRAVLAQAVEGNFEPMRRVLFAIATRQEDPEAALWRFLLWVTVRVNLLALTWDDPGIEMRGSLDEAEDHAETALRTLLSTVGGELQDQDCRPLHLLMAETLVHLYLFDGAVREALGAFKADVIEELLVNIDALESVRRLGAKSAAAFWSGGSGVEVGSQQIADRFPQHFASANAVDQNRRRTRKRVRKGGGTENRLIDLIRDSEGRS